MDRRNLNPQKFFLEFFQEDFAAAPDSVAVRISLGLTFTQVSMETRYNVKSSKRSMIFSIKMLLITVLGEKSTQC